MNAPNRDIVIAYHLVWTAYEWWLPNDPRGSMSRKIISDVILELGELHYGRRKVQPAGWVVRDFYERAEPLLKFPLLTFTEAEIQVVAESFRAVVGYERYTCYACALMPDHVHVLIRKHRDRAEGMIANLQEASRLALQKHGFRPGHPVWGGPGWKVFLYQPVEVWRTIRYIEENPPKMRLPRQNWDFVRRYDNWPLHKRSR